MELLSALMWPENFVSDRESLTRVFFLLRDFGDLKSDERLPGLLLLYRLGSLFGLEEL